MENKTEIEFTRNLRCSQVFTDSSAEYVLPDYNGDIRKILHTSADVRPSGKFFGGDEVEFSGIVVYEVIYLDEENKLTSVSFTSDYDYSVKCSSETYRDSFAETLVANYSLRLIGPRKIATTASVVGNVRISECCKVFVDGDAFIGDERPETMCKHFKIRKSISSECREREYAESMAKLEGAIAEEVFVISTSADAVIDEMSAGDGEVTFRGNLTILAIIKNGDAPAYQREKIVQIEESVPFAEVSDQMRFIPTVNVGSLVTSINAHEVGTEVVVSAVMEFSAVGEYNEEGDVISDAYLKSCAIENKYEDFAYCELLDTISSCESENGAVQRSEIDAENVREVLVLRAVPKVDSVVCDNDKLTVSGELKYSGVASVTDSEGNLGYVPLKFSLPFERALKVSGGDSLIPEVTVKSHGTNATFDASKLYASCLLEVTAVVSEEKHISRLALSRKNPEHPYEKDASRIIVYYPGAEDNLFLIAKKYKTTALKIASDNDLEAEVVADLDGKISSLGVKKLLIY